MIRIGKYEDINQGIDLLKEHIKEFNYGECKQDLSEYYKGLLDAIIKDKTCVVSVDDNGTINGCLLGMRIPNIVNPTNVQFHVLFTWVNPNKRGSSIFYRMNKLLEKEIVTSNEDIIYYNYEDKTNINHNKLGYEVLQTMYIKRK